MSARELIGKRRGGISGRVREYFVSQAANESDAISAAVAIAPLTVDGYIFSGQTFDDTDVEGCYIVTLEWGLGDAAHNRRVAPNGIDEPETGSSSFTFEVGVQPTRVILPPYGGSINIYAPPAAYGPDLPDPHVIGDAGDKDHTTEGVEVYEPYFEFSETHYLAAAAVDNAYKASVCDLVGRLNDDTFRGWEAESVLAKGVSGALRRQFGDWEITFRFARKKHQTGLTIGDVTYDKKAWQYVWPMMKTVNNHHYLGQEVKFVCTADLYETGDFSGFGIGTA